jgi:autotransporter passenger strand-loop-strand repeat protein
MTTDIYVSSGVTSTGLTIQPGQDEIVLTGGKAVATTVSGISAEQDVSAGGTALGTTLEGYGTEYVFSGGLTSATTVDADSVLQVQSGAKGINTVVNNSGLEEVYGTASGSIVNSGGDELVGGGGAAISATINSGGTQIANGSGAVSGAVIKAGGAQYVGSGAAVTGTVVSGGGLEQVGGTTTFHYYYLGITETIDLSGGIVSDTIVTGAAATQAVSSGGTAIGTTLENFGVERVYSGGVVSHTTIDADSVMVLGSGATGSGTVVNSAGLAQVNGTTSGTVVNSGGDELTGAGAVVNNTTLDGGVQIAGGGTVSGTIVSSGGAEYVGSGSTATGTVVSSGGVEQVGGTVVFDYYYAGGILETFNLSGGIAADTIVSSGGTEVVSSGGTTTGTIIRDGLALVYSGGAAVDTVISNGGTDYLAGGNTTGTIISSGGTEAAYGGGLALDATVSNGGTLFGFASAATILSGGYERAGAGYSSLDTTVSSGGIEELISGGTAVDTIVLGGGTLTVDSGGTASNTVLSGGIAAVSAGGVAVGTVISNGGTLYGPGPASGTIILNGGYEQIGYSGSTFDTTISSGGVEHVTSTGSAVHTVVSGGGTLTVDSAGNAISAVISSGGELVISSGASVTDTILNSGGSIDVTYAPYVSGATWSLNSSTDVLTVTEGGHSYTFQMAGAYTSGFHLSDDGGNTLITLCFCAGTRIATPSGEVAVETLREGDTVLTLRGEAKPIRWIGMGRSLITARNRGKAAPVIVRAGALGKGVPARDLRITRGHSLYLDGVLVPAENLVNGRTILWDDAAQVVEYYHIELDGHDVLIADGAPAESYRDDGNGVLFQTARPEGREAPPPYAPVIENGPVLERIWKRLDALAGPRAPIATTTDPDLHLLVDGVRVDACAVDGGLHVFRLAQKPGTLRIVSRSAVPAELGRSADQRRLGVALSRIVLRTAGVSVALGPEICLAEHGFHKPEAKHFWTNGDAQLDPKVLATVESPLNIELYVTCTASYPIAARIVAAA